MGKHGVLTEFCIFHMPRICNSFEQTGHGKIDLNRVSTTPPLYNLLLQPNPSAQRTHDKLNIYPGSIALHPTKNIDLITNLKSLFRTPPLFTIGEGAGSELQNALEKSAEKVIRQETKRKTHQSPTRLFIGMQSLQTLSFSVF
jgi:hypothetical protein